MKGKAGNIDRFPSIHYGELKEICRLKPKKLSKVLGLTRYETPDGKEYWFKDNGSKTLFVGHVDTVMPFTHFDTSQMRHDTLIFCPTLDDRLGIYIGTRWLPKAGINCDILLTTDEEKGKSTGYHFVPPPGKKYNWMFMFDRAGTDAVCYDYADTGTRTRLENVGYKVSRGSYSCIADMEHLGIKGFNFGTAYYANHDLSAHASKNGLTESLRKFLAFYKLYGHVEMIHKAKDEVVSYQEFSKIVDKHVVKSQPKKAGFSRVKPSEDVNHPRKFYESMGLGKAAPRAFESYGEMKRALDRDPIWLDFQITMVVTRNGKTTANSRIGKLLYFDINTLPIDSTTKLILKNTCSIKTIYDLVQWSKWKLLATRKLTLQAVLQIQEELNRGGFSLPQNVQGFQSPQDYERLRPVVRVHKKNQKEKVKITKQVTSVIGEPKPGPSTENSGPRGGRELIVVPISQQSREDSYKSTKELVGRYGGVTFNEKCLECQEMFAHDLTKEEIGPQLCPSCLSQARKSVISFPVKTKTDPKGKLKSKFSLEGKTDDEKVYKYLGKRKGWCWVEQEPKQERDYARTNIGFTADRAKSI